ncbi:unnamed protein product [Musa acuminata subsp. malaccensis]|uniref:(wild Malaysian banana) hypothetical protein n=1 Tax=Musa acuminata subsp. malaccensis TaxID=214687 RepID=A0A804L704_MUSAM|nr:unnamed protein product [Musa acuminata subsp. malaccensis]
MEFWVCGLWQGKRVAIFPVSFRILMMFLMKKNIVVAEHLELSMLLFDKLILSWCLLLPRCHAGLGAGETVLVFKIWMEVLRAYSHLESLTVAKI